MTTMITFVASSDAYLVKADKENIFRLSCIDHARKMIDHNNMIRLCGFDETGLILNSDALIYDRNVNFVDENTYISCLYTCDERNMIIKVYYDDKNVTGIDIDEQ